MSTTFAIYTHSRKNRMVPVAHRWNLGKNQGVGIKWLSDITKLTDDRKVYAMDNTAQGVDTIGDLRKLEITHGL